MPPTVPITCYVRTLNEADRLRPTLSAAAAVADELLVIDSGSTDDTVAIAEAAGARVIRQPWLGNGPQKRVGEAAARHDWLLDLDADEALSPELADEIRALFASGEPPAAVYTLDVTLCPPVGGPWRGFGIARRPKLYDRRRARVPDHPIHDQAEPAPGAATGRLNGPLIHRSFASAHDFMEKMNRVSTRNARHAARTGRRGRGTVALRVVFGLPFYLAKNLFGRGMIRGGAYGFATALMIATGRWLKDVKMYELAHGLDVAPGAPGATPAERDRS